MIEKMITPDLIKLRVKATDWEDAIHQAGEPLVKAGDVSQDYVEAIIASVKKNGPYFVIAPHVALAHAPIESGAKKQAMGLTTLDPAIKFNNPDNDPVRYVFTLSATDNNSHLKAMQELVELLSQDAFYDALDQAQSPDDVLRFINSVLQTEEKE